MHVSSSLLVKTSDSVKKKEVENFSVKSSVSDLLKYSDFVNAVEQEKSFFLVK